MIQAECYSRLDNGLVKCELCPHGCEIASGRTGLCRVRRNDCGVLSAESYGRVTSLSLDPIEKKPLYRFLPGSMILSLGSYGCNFRCGFCQNHEISMESPPYWESPPESVAALSLEMAAKGNIGLAYTYNEPLIAYEYVRDCARLVHGQGQKNVLVTNGFIRKEPLLELLPLIDAMNIDLKSFSAGFYNEIGGALDAVKQTVECAAKACHVEITTLVIPDKNDSAEEISGITAWIAGINPDIPLHLSRFFPRYKMSGLTPTPLDAMRKLKVAAEKHLRYVYLGNC